MTEAGTGLGGTQEPVALAGLADLAVLAADGPDEMGRELAEGPAAVEGALAAVERAAPVIAALFEQTQRTVLVGTGASLAAARTVAPLWRTRDRARGRDGPLLVRESTAALLGDADGEVFLPTDLVVAISQSGSSPETVAAARRAAEIGGRVVGVSAAAASPLSEVARVSVVTPSGEEGGAATKSALSALAALLAIPGAVATDAASRVVLADRLRDVVADWPSAAALGPVFGGADRLWIVGLGTAAGLTAAAGLLWHEKAHRPAVTTTVSEFRHGPVEAARPEDAVLLLDVDPPVTARAGYLTLLREELGRLGVPLVTVAPDAPAEQPGIRLGLAAGGPAALEALLRLQQLARATAHAAGTYQDGFRILRVIVRAAPPLD
jgi:glucosamine--fructose-6-phosphate aminotransferase (isomerizing)